MGSSLLCTRTTDSREAAEVKLSVSKNTGVDILRCIRVYILNPEGTEKGKISRKSTMSHKTKKVLLGRVFIAMARMITTATIKTAQEKLISNKPICITSF